MQVTSRETIAADEQSAAARELMECVLSEADRCALVTRDPLEALELGLHIGELVPEGDTDDALALHAPFSLDELQEAASAGLAGR